MKISQFQRRYSPDHYVHVENGSKYNSRANLRVENKVVLVYSNPECGSRCVVSILDKYRIAGNFRGRKLSRISRFFRHPRKFSLRNSRHATPIMRPLLTFRESFLREMLLSYRSAKVFSLENFPLYGTSQNCHH